MKKRVLGFILLILGLFLMVTLSPRFTGLVIYENSAVVNGLKILGLVIFIGGVLLLSTHRIAEEGLEEKIDVYDDGIGKSSTNRDLGQHYFMADKKSDFSREGRVSLGEFRRQIKLYKEEGSEELVEVVRQEYGPGLHRIVLQGGEKSKVARAFLDVLEGSQEKQDYHLSREDNREITEAFRNYNGRFTSQQKEVLKKHGLTYEQGGKHIAIIKNGERIFTLAKTPSDHRTGLNHAKDLIKALEKYESD